DYYCNSYAGSNIYWIF
nr:immunoglobulin light chain junction region [Macaca mulatta]